LSGYCIEEERAKGTVREEGNREESCVLADEARIAAAETVFGGAREVAVTQELLEWELDLIERICGHTRFHDVTVFTLVGGCMALVRKPSDPPGAFWAPTGGVEQGEELADAVIRETWEETGLHVEPERYLLRMRALFTCGRRRRPWTSHVFLARHVSGELRPIDTHEIEAASWVGKERFRDEIVPLLLAAGWGRFCYRLCISRLLYGELGWGELSLPPILGGQQRREYRGADLVSGGHAALVVETELDAGQP
jgi:ADP-ribose pyrophosphatase YjhB (NUDIX family)